MQRFAWWNLTKLFFSVFQAKGASRKSKLLVDDSPLKENGNLLAQNEYEEDSSDEEVGPVAAFLSTWVRDGGDGFPLFHAGFSANSKGGEMVK